MARLSKNESGVNGGASAITPSSGTTLLLAVRPNRVRALVKNNGSNTVYLGVNSATTTSSGYPLAADADSGDLFEGYGGPIWVAVGAVSDVRAFEVF